MLAYLSQNAFWGLLISAVEVYKKECFGLLIGHLDRQPGKEMFVVEHAVPFQRRAAQGVVASPRVTAGSSASYNLPQMCNGDFLPYHVGYTRAASHPSG
jgi:hypothetical protein